MILSPLKSSPDGMKSIMIPQNSRFRLKNIPVHFSVFRENIKFWFFKFSYQMLKNDPQQLPWLSYRVEIPRPMKIFLYPSTNILSVKTFYNLQIKLLNCIGHSRNLQFLLKSKKKRRTETELRRQKV